MPETDDARIPAPRVGAGASGANPLVVAIDKAVEAQRDLEQQLRAEFGVNNTDFRALLLVFRLQRRGLGVRASDLQRGLGVSSGAASQITARLTRAELLERSSDPEDARAGALTLTEIAARHLATSTEGVQHDLDALLATLAPAEEERIITLLDQVRSVFQDHRRGRDEK